MESTKYRERTERRDTSIITPLKERFETSREERRGKVDKDKLPTCKVLLRSSLSLHRQN